MILQESQLSTEKFQLKSQLTSFYTVSTLYKVQINPNHYDDHYISNASEQLAPIRYGTANFQKLFTLQMHFLRYRDKQNVFGLFFLANSQKTSFYKIECSHLSVFTSVLLWFENCIHKLFAANLWSFETILFIYLKNNSWSTSNCSTRMFFFHWLCIYWFCLHSNHSCSTDSFIHFSESMSKLSSMFLCGSKNYSFSKSLLLNWRSSKWKSSNWFIQLKLKSFSDFVLLCSKRRSKTICSSLFKNSICFTW